ncbi:hypothetical protein D9756_010376 [Leucocoprinus leucothites]|uniref:Lanosterol 14-alpha-demethylase n=1 Tax=Leucocoprinus leucothites TaxID=201217 RepID=A0A8H5FRB5_9AGAR|nr:hypothetical protein D9756_010376 [Leucoagaricus leucothites]
MNLQSYFTGYLSLVQPLGTVMTPSTFSSSVTRSMATCSLSSFFGRRITVALGSKGNNFVLGGKSIVFNARGCLYASLRLPYSARMSSTMSSMKFSWSKRNSPKLGLSTDNLRAYVGMIEEEVEEFLRGDTAFSAFQSGDVNEWGQFDPLKALQAIAILTASKTLQGQEVREAMDKSFAEIYNDLDGGFTPLNFLFPNLPLPSYRKRDIAHKKISDFYVNIIQQRRNGSTTDHEHDMIAALMQQNYRDGRPLKDHEIAHIMITLLMAGQHTSSATCSWAPLHIAERPDISIMRYVRDDMPIPGTLAAPEKDSTYVVPKGHYVLASPLVSQLDPQTWKDADKREPTRWSDSEGVAAQAYKTYEDAQDEKIDYGFGAVSKGTESLYQPFGAGKHRCIGEQFAYLQLGTIIATIVRHMEIKIDQVPEHNYHVSIFHTLAIVFCMGAYGYS